MSQTIELGGTSTTSTTLLITTSSSSSNSKCRRRWRSTWHVLRISLHKKPTTTATNYYDYEDEEEEEEEESPLSSLPIPYTPLPLPPTRTSSSKSFLAIDISDQEEEENNHIARILKDKDFKSLLHFGGVDRVRHVLQRQRQRQHSSSNSKKTTTVGDGTRFSDFLWNSCKQNCYTVSMLLISAIFSFAIEFLQEGPKYGWHDGVAIIFAVILLVTFSSTSNFWRQRKLAKKIGEMRFTVERGERVDLSISDIVVGDLVFLRPHDEVPADGLLVSLGILIVMPKGIKKQKIDPEGNPFLIAGSKVIAGHGCMLVTSSSSVGNKSNLAEMKRGLLESLIEKSISYIDKPALFIYTLVALVVLIRLICKKDVDNYGGLPEIKGNVSFGLMMKVLEGIFLRTRGNISNLGGLLVLLVLCVQHGVPLMIAFSHKYNIDKVVPDQDAILNDLSACTKMGLVTVICIDVSGGIISKPMEVSKIWMGERETDINKVEKGSETDLNNVLDNLKEGVGLSVIAPELSFSPMSNALASWAETTWQMDFKTCTEKFDILKHSKLNSDKESSGVLVRNVIASEQIQHLHWSGDASTILKMCSKYYDSEGECHAMANQEIDFEQVINDMKDSGLVPFAFAYRQTDVQEVLEQHEPTVLALIGLQYKCLESTKLALENLQNNGVKIKLVSEDDDPMACELGIQVPTYGGFLEGEQFKDLNDKARLDKVEQAVVMASFSAEDKLLMVKCLQDKGHVVAFIEPWLITNHSSQILKAADVGIVHNSLRRVINKESCGISIISFNALEPIMRDGRSKYHNIQKFIQLQITVSISGLLLTLITTISTGKSPLTAIQLIWVNLLMCLLGSIMMAMELSSGEELANKPSNDRNQPFISKKNWKNIVIQVLYQALACMTLEFWGHVTDESEKKIRKTMIFNTFLLCQLFNLLNTIHLLKREVFNIVVQSYCFTVGLGVCFAMQVVVIEYANGLADCMRLNAATWAVCVLIGGLSWIFEWTLNIILCTNCASPFDSPSHRNLDTLFIRLLLFPLGLIGITYLK